MSQKTFSLVASAVFAVVAIMHLLRIINGLEAVAQRELGPHGMWNRLAPTRGGGGRICLGGPCAVEERGA